MGEAESEASPPPPKNPDLVSAKGKEPAGISHGNIQAGEGSGEGGVGSNKPTVEPQSKQGQRIPGQCIPKSAEIPSLVLKSANLRGKIQYMKDHALIGKFIGIWPNEKALQWWIQTYWKPKGHIDLQLGAKGFFTVIFFNVEDRNRVFEGGPYFFNSAGLFLRYWKEKFNPDREDMTVAPVWVRLYSLPTEYWLPEILEDIGNTLGSFVKISEQTKLSRYTSYARICVYMNISNDLPEAINLSWEDEAWTQPLDYEHIPFRCRKCHKHGHLFRDCPMNNPPETSKAKETKDSEGFTKVNNKRRNPKKLQSPEVKGTINTSNSFDVLSNVPEEEIKQNNPEIQADIPPDPKHRLGTSDLAGKKDTSRGITENMKEPDENETPMEEDEVGDIELGELDLDSIEEACANKGVGYIPFRQVQLLQEAILKLKPSPKLGVGGSTLKEIRKKFKESGTRRGRKTDNQRIKEAGVRMVESGMYPTIKEALEQASGSSK